MQSPPIGCLPSGVPKIKPAIGHFVPREQLNFAYKKIDEKAERVVWKSHGITCAGDFNNVSENKSNVAKPNSANV